MFGSLGHFIGNLFNHPTQAQSPVSPGLLQAINHASGFSPSVPKPQAPNPGVVQAINHATGMPNRLAGVPGATPAPNPGLLQAINHAAGLPNRLAGVPGAAPAPVSSSLLHAINAATGFQPHVAPQHPNLQPPRMMVPNGINDPAQGSYLTGMQGGSIFQNQWQQPFNGGNNAFQPSVSEGWTGGPVLQGGQVNPQLLNTLYRSIY